MWHVGMLRASLLEGVKGSGLVQGVELGETSQLVEHGVVHEHRPGPVATVDDAVGDGATAGAPARARSRSSHSTASSSG